MSTFTRLYFVDRGPGLAAQDNQELHDEAGERIGSPDIAPGAPRDVSETDREAIEVPALFRLAEEAAPRHPPAPARGGPLSFLRRPFDSGEAPDNRDWRD